MVRSMPSVSVISTRRRAGSVVRSVSPEAHLPLLLATEVVAAQGDEDAAGPVAEPLLEQVGRRRPGRSVVHADVRDPTAAGQVGDESDHRDPLGVQPGDGVSHLGHIGGLEQDPVGAAKAMRSTAATMSAIGPVSRKLKRALTTAGRSVGSAVSSADRTALENRSGACITTSNRNVRPPSWIWVCCRCSSVIAGGPGSRCSREPRCGH